MQNGETKNKQYLRNDLGRSVECTFRQIPVNVWEERLNIASGFGEFGVHAKCYKEGECRVWELERQGLGGWVPVKRE